MVLLDQPKEYFECSCCGYKTLEENGQGYSTYEICFLCWWEDDWTYGGANGDYTLEEAQDNFKKYYTMYRVSDPERYFVLYKDIIEIKKKIMSILDEIKFSSSIKERTQLRSQVNVLESELRKAQDKLPIRPNEILNA